MLSLSPAGDMLVVPTHGLPAVPLAPRSVRANDGSPFGDVFGPARYFRGSRPEPLGEPGHTVSIGRVLAWSADSTSVLVAGEVNDRSGIYLVDTSARRERSPRYVGEIDGLTFATFAGADHGFVLSGGQISRLQGGLLEPLDLPDGAPAPDGPLVWLP